MKISIIGVGLIGGSIGLALRNQNNKFFKNKKITIVGVGRKPLRLALAQRLGAIDKFTTSIKDGVKDADIIFIATPVKTIPRIFEEVILYCKTSAIITDVGSVKVEVLKKIKQSLAAHLKKSSTSAGKGPFFVSSHPIAGGEKTSVVYAKPDLFKNAVTVITPLNKKTPRQVIDTIKKLWLAIGSKVYIMSPEHHDDILARTSHLPHIVAYALVNSLKIPTDKNYTGPGWRDTTRIASSDPDMWAEIINLNKNAVLKALKKLKSNIAQIEKSLSDEKSLSKIFSKSKNTRDSIHSTP